ncbi:uncharacterized protein V1518DRAFT_411698 [Limtongia smithiae]|uniref:uncharacterized protein n=1 Tax=Limtongia smithiae TaxID=1125753 RepID=UPI0034CF5AFE
MPIKLLQHKSYHVYNDANIERVRRDEAEARAREEEEDEQQRERDRAYRLELLRQRQRGDGSEQAAQEDVSMDHLREDSPQKSKSSDRACDTGRHVESIDREKRHGVESNKRDREYSEQREQTSITHVHRDREEIAGQEKHINLFEDLEKGDAESKVQKRRATETAKPKSSFAKEQTPWYASLNEPSSEAADRTGERDRRAAEKAKSFADPLASMRDFLKQKKEADRRRRELEGWNSPQGRSGDVERGTERYYVGEDKNRVARHRGQNRSSSGSQCRHGARAGRATRRRPAGHDSGSSRSR